MSRGLGDEEQLEKEAEKSGDEQRTRRLRMAEGKMCLRGQIVKISLGLVELVLVGP